MKLLKVIFFFACINLFAQQKSVEAIYFDFDKYELSNLQIKAIVDFVKAVDTSKIESLQIYGYCDDRGSDHYNYQLSRNRVNTVRRILIGTGFEPSKIIILEGKGRIVVGHDTIENLHETRSKNRRVDVVIAKKNPFGEGVYDSFKGDLKIGDKVFLENILFDIGSAELTVNSKKELDKIAVILLERKTIRFEIDGHVCCTSEVYNDGIDKKTGERKLSWNRAKAVFHYLTSKKISKSRMTYQGFGNKYPLKIGDNFDRRVEFIITKI